MIPILFAPKTREYNNNGLGVLVDVGFCTVTEERNGAFELELQYPVNGSHYADLAVDCQVLAKPNETSEPQAFRIYNISKPMNGVVTVRAEHISYELSSVIVSPFSASNIGEALSKIKSNSVTENVFTFWTDKNTVANMSQSTPKSARSLLGGVEGSILDVYTGEYEFDNYTVKLHQNRGADNGVTISYAKNLTGVKCEERSDGIVTGAIAYWTGETDGIAQAVYGDLQTIETSLSYSRNVIVDCSSEFTGPPSKASLNEYATKYIKEHKNIPYFSVSVEFVNLGDTEEYKQYKGLHRVSLCDTVTVRHPLYGIDVKSKVVKTVFDSVREKYEKIEIGEVSANISQTIVAQEKEIAQKVGFSELDKAVANATSAIAGNKGGYVVLYPNAIQPQELLILDKPNVNEAVNVWRWNLAGLGHSSTGYNGTFSTAITADGQIVADFIKAGTLEGVEVVAESGNISGLSLSKNGLSANVSHTYPKYTQADLDKAQAFILGSGSLTAEEIAKYDVNFNGTIKSNDLFIMHKMILGKIETNVNGELRINTNSAVETIVISSTSGPGKGNKTIIGVGGVVAPSLTATGEIYAFGDLTTDGMFTSKKRITAMEDIYAYGGISGATITNRSDRKIKKNIEPTKTKNALSSVKSLNVYDYDLKETGNSVKMGLMADEAPEEILAENKKGINLYSYCGLLAMAIQEMSEKIEKLEKGGKDDVGNAE